MITRVGHCIAWTIDPGRLHLPRRLRPTPRPDHETRIRTRRNWNALREQIPRLFDGAAIAITEPEPGAHSFPWFPSTYREIIASTRATTFQLSVSGCVFDDANRMLLTKRSPHVRAYPNMWEIAPAGGINPPSPRARRLSTHSLIAALRTESDEELGPSMTAWTGAYNTARPAAAVFDPTARSLDLVLMCRRQTPPPPATESWETAGAIFADAARIAELVRQKSLIDASIASLEAMDII